MPQVIFVPKAQASTPHITPAIAHYLTTQMIDLKGRSGVPEHRKLTEADWTKINEALNPHRTRASQDPVQHKPPTADATAITHGIKLKRHNPFATPDSGYLSPTPKQTTGPGVLDGRTKSRLLREKLTREYRKLNLQTVVGGRMAMISGKLYHLSEEVGSFQIVGIDEKHRTVTLEALGVMYILRQR